MLRNEPGDLFDQIRCRRLGQVHIVDMINALMDDGIFRPFLDATHRHKRHLTAQPVRANRFAEDTNRLEPDDNLFIISRVPAKMDRQALGPSNAAEQREQHTVGRKIVDVKSVCMRTVKKWTELRMALRL